MEGIGIWKPERPEISYLNTKSGIIVWKDIHFTNWSLEAPKEFTWLVWIMGHIDLTHRRLYTVCTRAWLN